MLSGADLAKGQSFRYAALTKVKAVSLAVMPSLWDTRSQGLIKRKAI